MLPQAMLFVVAVALRTTSLAPAQQPAVWVLPRWYCQRECPASEGDPLLRALRGGGEREDGENSFQQTEVGGTGKRGRGERGVRSRGRRIRAASAPRAAADREHLRRGRAASAGQDGRGRGRGRPGRAARAAGTGQGSGGSATTSGRRRQGKVATEEVAGVAGMATEVGFAVEQPRETEVHGLPTPTATPQPRVRFKDVSPVAEGQRPKNLFLYTPQSPLSPSASAASDTTSSPPALPRHPFPTDTYLPTPPVKLRREGAVEGGGGVLSDSVDSSAFENESSRTRRKRRDKRSRLTDADPQALVIDSSDLEVGSSSSAVEEDAGAAAAGRGVVREVLDVDHAAATRSGKDMAPSEAGARAGAGNQQSSRRRRRGDASHGQDENKSAESVHTEWNGRRSSARMRERASESERERERGEGRQSLSGRGRSGDSRDELAMESEQKEEDAGPYTAVPGAAVGATRGRRRSWRDESGGDCARSRLSGVGGLLEDSDMTVSGVGEEGSMVEILDSGEGQRAAAVRRRKRDVVRASEAKVYGGGYLRKDKLEWKVPCDMIGCDGKECKHFEKWERRLNRWEEGQLVRTPDGDGEIVDKDASERPLRVRLEASGMEAWYTLREVKDLAKVRSRRKLTTSLFGFGYASSAGESEALSQSGAEDSVASAAFDCHVGGDGDEETLAQYAVTSHAEALREEYGPHASVFAPGGVLKQSLQQLQEELGIEGLEMRMWPGQAQAANASMARKMRRDNFGQWQTPAHLRCARHGGGTAPCHDGDACTGGDGEWGELWEEEWEGDGTSRAGEEQPGASEVGGEGIGGACCGGGIDPRLRAFNTFVSGLTGRGDKERDVVETLGGTEKEHWQEQATTVFTGRENPWEDTRDGRGRNVRWGDLLTLPERMTAKLAPNWDLALPCLERDILLSGLVQDDAEADAVAPADAPSEATLWRVAEIAYIFRRFRDFAAEVHLENPRQMAEHVLREFASFDESMIRAALIVRQLCESVPSLEADCQDPPPPRSPDLNLRSGVESLPQFRPAGAYNGSFAHVAHFDNLGLDVSVREDWSGVLARPERTPGCAAPKGDKGVSQEGNDDGWGFVPDVLNVSEMIRTIDESFAARNISVQEVEHEEVDFDALVAAAAAEEVEEEVAASGEEQAAGSEVEQSEVYDFVSWDRLFSSAALKTRSDDKDTDLVGENDGAVAAQRNGAGGQSAAGSQTKRPGFDFGAAFRGLSSAGAGDRVPERDGGQAEHSLASWMHGGVALLGGYNGNDYLDSVDIWTQGQGATGRGEMARADGRSMVEGGGGAWHPSVTTLQGIEFSMGRRRGFLQAQCYGGKIFALGGFYAHAHGVRCSQVESFELGTWARRKEPELLSPRAWHSSAAVGGRLWVAGGNDGVQHLRTSEFLEVGKDDQGWRRGPDMLYRRYSPAAAACSGAVFVAGGYGSTVDACHVSNLDFTDSVEMLPAGSSKFVAAATLPFAMARMGLATLNGRVYCVGGYDGSTALETVFSLDPREGSWMREPSMKLRRSYLGVVSLGNSVIALGGFNGVLRRRPCY